VIIKFDSTLTNVEFNYERLFKLLKKLPEAKKEITILEKEKNIICHKFDWINNLYTYEVNIK